MTSRKGAHCGEAGRLSLQQLTNREIGQYFGAISYSAVTKAKDRFEKVLPSDRTMRRIFEKIKRGISRFNRLTPPPLGICLSIDR
jgi:hypothetical protein